MFWDWSMIFSSLLRNAGVSSTADVPTFNGIIIRYYNKMGRLVTISGHFRDLACGLRQVLSTLRRRLERVVRVQPVPFGSQVEQATLREPCLT